MNHNRDSTVSSIVDLYGPEASKPDPHDRERYPDIQEEDSSDHINRSIGDQEHEAGPSGSSSGLPPPLDLTFSSTDRSGPEQPSHRSIHPSRSALTSASSYPTSSNSHLREQSSTSSSFRAVPGPSRFTNGNGNARLGLNGAYNESAASFVSVQQPGEEDDAYHVRSTCKQASLYFPSLSRLTVSHACTVHPDGSDARLEVQGVYGDGWDEGIERTRERAIVKRRESDPPTRPGDGLGDEERQALGRVDR